jgi:hypothetical protein
MPVIPRNAYNRLNFESSEKEFVWYCGRLSTRISKPDHEVPAIVMDQSMMSRHLATADRHIADGQRQITEQEETIERLRQDGAGTAREVRFLQVLKESLYRAHTCRIT